MILFHRLLGEGELRQRVLEVILGFVLLNLLFFVYWACMALRIVVFFLHLQNVCPRNKPIEQTVTTLARDLILYRDKNVLQIHDRIMESHRVFGQICLRPGDLCGLFLSFLLGFGHGWLSRQHLLRQLILRLLQLFKVTRLVLLNKRV